MTIKEISGGVLLYLYVANREDPLDTDFRNYYFRYDESQWASEKKLNEFQSQLLQTAQGSEKDLLNAIMYLHDAGLIFIETDGSDMGGRMYRDMRPTAAGIDLIEGIEREEGSTRHKFNITFNFKLDSLMKIAPTLANKFGLVNIG